MEASPEGIDYFFGGAQCSDKKKTMFSHIEVFRQEALLRVHLGAPLIAWVGIHWVEGHILVAGEGHHTLS